MLADYIRAKTATVGELKKSLKKFDDNTPICYSNTEDGSPVAIIGITDKDDFILVE